MFNLLHFAHPLWLWAGLAIPLVWLLCYRINLPLHQLEKYIDSHLLPYLLVDGKKKARNPLLWTLVWTLLTLALAGPRWTYREMETFSKDQSLVILLDLSESMNATDIKPSRLARARQKIEDLINGSRGLKIGLIAFAADPHMIAPLTDDRETIRHLLPTLETDLVYIQGSRLSPALDMASTMLQAEPGHNKAVLVISDGGFEDASAIKTAKKLAEKGIVIHAMGLGTPEGAPLKDHEGNVIQKNGVPILSKLEKERFSEISRAGHGHYLEAHQDEGMILRDLEQHSEDQIALGKKNRIWDEHFYLLIFPALPLILWWFRRGYLFAFILFIPAFNLQAADYFKNSDQLGKEALETGDYETASHMFQDPYRKGVSCYRAGNFAEAEKCFLQSSRPEVASSAAYNLGNALVQQKKLQEAVQAYEEVLKQWPEHTKAKENLEIVKKMLEQQNQSDQQKSKPDKNDNSQNSKNQEDKSEQDPKSQDSKNQEDKSKQDPKSQDSKSPDDKQNQEKAEKQDSPSTQDERPDQHKQELSQQAKPSKTQEDQDADLLLNRIENDPKSFMKNKFYIESKKNGTTEGIDPW